MVISTPVLPKPPACVLAAVRPVSAPSVPSLDERIADAELKAAQDVLVRSQLVETFRGELPELVAQCGLWNVVEALRIVLGEEPSPTTGQEMTCSITLRPTVEAQGWW